MKPWKVRTSCPASATKVLLQWGHGDEAVEEPERYSGTAQDLRSFQWGHGDEAVEELVNIGSGYRNSGFEWGHGDEAVEERLRPSTTFCR